MCVALAFALLAGTSVAVHSEPVGDLETIHAMTATRIDAIRVDGGFVLGETIELGGTIERGSCGVATAFDQFSGIDVCSFGDLYPQSGVLQNAVEDVVPMSGTSGASISCFSVAATRPLCDLGQGTTSEECVIAVLSWEIVDNIPDLDGSDGFDSGVSGLVTPMRRSDADGDTFIDEFNGGLIFTFADTDTDGDTVADELLSSGSAVFSATVLDSFGVPMPSGQDFNNDGRSDGGIQVLITRGDGGDGQGPLFGGFYPATNARILFGATAEDDQSGCLTTNGVGEGSSTGALWGEGYAECGATGAWSDGSSSDSADDLFDPLVDLRDLYDAVPGFESVGIAIKIGTGDVPCGDSDCCDTNRDGQCTPSDFNAWINEYNLGGPRCDINDDGQCTPTDFNAWLNAFNNSQAGNPFVCNFCN